MRMFIISKNKYLSNYMKIFGTCSIPLRIYVKCQFSVSFHGKLTCGSVSIYQSINWNINELRCIPKPFIWDFNSATVLVAKSCVKWMNVKGYQTRSYSSKLYSFGQDYPAVYTSSWNPTCFLANIKNTIIYISGHYVAHSFIWLSHTLQLVHHSLLYAQV